MATRLDALTVREYTDRDGNKKASWTKIGSAFETRDGWNVVLDALPLPAMGDRGMETKIVLKTPRPKEDAPSRTSYDRDDPRTNQRDYRDLDDEIPF